MKWSALALASALLFGCATIKQGQPAEYSFEKNRKYPQPFETVWVRAVDWFADHNVTIEKIEKSSGLLTARYRIKTDDTYLDCGKPEVNGILGTPRIDSLGSLNVTVRELGVNETRVNVNFFGEYKLEARDAWDGRLVLGSGRCVSTGQIEREILNFVGK